MNEQNGKVFHSGHKQWSKNYSAFIEYGIIRSDLESKGTPIGSLDTLIAAHAKSLQYTLFTNNKREFIRVNGLQVENWV